MSDVDWRDLVERLTIDEPWSWSHEGLDDCCQFCGSERREYGIDYPSAYTYHHMADCDWVEAMRALGRDLGQHRPDGGQRIY